MRTSLIIISTIIMFISCDVNTTKEPAYKFDKNITQFNFHYPLKKVRYFGETLSFSAIVYNEFNERIDITEAEWISDLDGLLSTASGFNKDDLSIGTHIITARVVDEFDNSASQTRAYTIKAVSDFFQLKILFPTNNYTTGTAGSIRFVAGYIPSHVLIRSKWESSIDGVILTDKLEHFWATNPLSVGEHTLYLNVKFIDNIEKVDSVTVIIQN